jgi:hypothetical protein
MTPDEFRELALSFSGTMESSHMNHPDFRAHGRIFATLGSPDAASGMVKLAMPDQQHFVTTHPHVFYPAKGAWGLQGSTLVHLGAARPDLIAQALELAWKHSAQAPAPKAAKKSKR